MAREYGLEACIDRAEEVDDRYQDRPLLCYYPVFNLTQCEEIEEIGEAPIEE
ncbi:MAG: hypothetical protein KAW93_00485 [Methanogenium sp.]|nr:hypothetical protein [Methanogenium sp.]